MYYMYSSWWARVSSVASNATHCCRSRTSTSSVVYGLDEKSPKLRIFRSSGFGLSQIVCTRRLSESIGLVARNVDPDLPSSAAPFVRCQLAPHDRRGLGNAELSPRILSRVTSDKRMAGTVDERDLTSWLFLPGC